MSIKELSSFVWFLLAAALFFGIYAVLALVIYALVLLIVGYFKPEWLNYFDRRKELRKDRKALLENGLIDKKYLYEYKFKDEVDYKHYDLIKHRFWLTVKNEDGKECPYFEDDYIKVYFNIGSYFNSLELTIENKVDGVISILPEREFIHEIGNPEERHFGYINRESITLNIENKRTIATLLPLKKIKINPESEKKGVMNGEKEYIVSLKLVYSKDKNKEYNISLKTHYYKEKIDRVNYFQ